MADSFKKLGCLGPLVLDQIDLDLCKESHEPLLRHQLTHQVVVIIELALDMESNYSAKSLVSFLLTYIFNEKLGINKYKALLKALNLDRPKTITIREAQPILIQYILGNTLMRNMTTVFSAYDELSALQKTIQVKTKETVLINQIFKIPVANWGWNNFPGDPNQHICSLTHERTLEPIQFETQEFTFSPVDLPPPKCSYMDNLTPSEFEDEFGGLSLRGNEPGAISLCRETKKPVLTSRTTCSSSQTSKLCSMSGVIPTFMEWPIAAKFDFHLLNNGYGEIEENGLHVTMQGILMMLTVHLQKLRGNKPQEDAIRKVLEVLASQGYFIDKDVPPPQTVAELMLSGLYWKEDDFEYLTELCRGSFGVVYAVSVNRRPLAHGALKIQCCGARQFVANFCRELSENTRIIHKNIVRVEGYFPISSVEDTQGKGGEICMGILFERCERNLRQEIRDARSINREPSQKLSWACGIMSDLLEGLIVLRCNQVRHRDIKPDNILLGKDGNWKIADFGLAREEDKNRPDTHVGTSNYLPPEKTGETQDVFAAGITFFELVTGGLPVSNTIGSVKTIEDHFGWAGVFQTKVTDLCFAMVHVKVEKRPEAEQALELLKVIQSENKNM